MNPNQLNNYHHNKGSSSTSTVPTSTTPPGTATTTPTSTPAPNKLEPLSPSRHHRSASDGKIARQSQTPANSPIKPSIQEPSPKSASIFSSVSNFFAVSNVTNALSNVTHSIIEVKDIFGNSSTPQNISTITRPSNLPKKSPEEELKHRKQYEEMMQRYREKLERDANLIKKKEEMKEQREKKILEATEEWKKGDIIQDWENKKNDKRTRELLWQGVPPNMRSLVWPLAVSNNLQITRDLFDICGSQGKAARRRRNSNEIGRVGTVSLIELDLPRTFPALTIFNKDGPCHEQLLTVLESYVCYRPDIGYVQGMSFIAAVLLLYLEPFPAFVCLANLLSRPLFVTFYRMDGDKIQQYVKVLETLMADKVPKVFLHFQDHNISSLVFIVDWVLTIFSKALPLEAVSRVWDNYFVEGDTFLWRTILGLLSFHSETLLKSSYDQSLQFLTHLPQNFDQDGLFESIAAIKLSPAQLAEVLKSHGLS
eukprot:TRINITY_DN3458_c0_g1_i2.p1 TRINITY_DN3458_c0_g1~~TRINITY_DN3458_c0_g1_i2.p1  ORF type:complete len:481 (-),score=78.86 TRINITY_DN3458_c0_g1_i2:55-1497(-)